MPDHLPTWLGNLHDALSQPSCGVIVTLTAVLCGGAVGVERGKQNKPAGLRTMMLICLGATIFTQAGLLLAGPDADRARIAAQVVTGVGFLGAGAIIHARGKIIGFTTAAAIWVVAAIGLVIGSGYVAAGVFFTLLVVATLMLEPTLGAMIDGACVWTTIRIEFDPDNGKTRRIIQGIFDEHLIEDKRVRFEPPGAATAAVTIDYCDRHLQHRVFLPEIAALPAVQRISEQSR